MDLSLLIAIFSLALSLITLYVTNLKGAKFKYEPHSEHFLHFLNDSNGSKNIALDYKVLIANSGVRAGIIKDLSIEVIDKESSENIILKSFMFYKFIVDDTKRRMWVEDKPTHPLFIKGGDSKYLSIGFCGLNNNVDFFKKKGSYDIALRRVVGKKDKVVAQNSFYLSDSDVKKMGEYNGESVVIKLS